jgi:hypothetical protein
MTVLIFGTLNIYGVERYQNSCFIAKCTIINWDDGYLQIKISLNQRMLFWLCFVTCLIQNFNAASDEKQKC